MSFIFTLIFSMFAADVAWWIWAHRSLRRIHRARAWRIAIGIFMSVQLATLLTILIGRAMGFRAEGLFPRIILAGVFVWHFLILPVGVLILGSDLLGRGAARLSRFFSSTPQPAPESTAPSRRELFRAVAVAAPPVLTVISTGASLAQLNGFRIRPIEIALPQLPAVLDGLRIAHVTDIHVGRFTTGNVLRKIVDATNSLRADLVLLTGDLINSSLSDLPAALDAVRGMDARHGVFMCEGNHDLMEGRPGFEDGVKRSGVPLLINESAMLRIRGQDVQLLGLKWGPSRSDIGISQSMQLLMPQVLTGAFPILLAHHPHAFEPAAEAGIPLTLAGHTHGGQIMASPNFGFGPAMFRYWSGLYHKGENKLVVANGVGNWFPLRINAPAEIIDITLRRVLP